MTDRKPPGVSFETWVDQQIREATARGAFDDLPGAGEPIRDLDKPYDELWVMRKLRQEGVPTEELLPTPLRLRREKERLVESVGELASERAVRDAAGELNRRILDWLRAPGDGPRLPVGPVNADDLVRRWHTARQPPPPVSRPVAAGSRAAEPPAGRTGLLARVLRALRRAGPGGRARRT